MNFTLSRTIEVLEQTPATLRALLGNLSEFWTLNNYGEKTFSPFDVVGHLIHAERTNWLPRLRCILERGESQPFPLFDRYAMYETSRGKTMGILLEEFAAIRAQKLETLRGMNVTDSQLDQRGTHPDFGAVTARQLLSTWTVHDLNHLSQIAKSMAFQYRQDVGPWRAFLSILPRS